MVQKWTKNAVRQAPAAPAFIIQQPTRFDLHICANSGFLWIFPPGRQAPRKRKTPENRRIKPIFGGYCLELLIRFERTTCSLRVSCSASWATQASLSHSTLKTKCYLTINPTARQLLFSVSPLRFCQEIHSVIISPNDAFSPAFFMSFLSFFDWLRQNNQPCKIRLCLLKSLFSRTFSLFFDRSFPLHSIYIMTLRIIFTRSYPHFPHKVIHKKVATNSKKCFFLPDFSAIIPLRTRGNTVKGQGGIWRH